MNYFRSRDGRKHLYLVCLAAVPLLVAYGIITADTAPLWIALAGAIIAPSVALRNLSPDQRDQDADG